MIRFTLLLVVVIAMAAPAQFRVNPSDGQEFRAQIRGGGGDRGKCTIEVEVDDVAEVDVRGEVGRIRTISGTPAVWRRFVCNIAMPLHPNQFRYRGIDGRGKQQLTQPPDLNRPAIIRIEDPRGGREGYTFDLEWRGVASTSASGSGASSGVDWGSSGSASGSSSSSSSNTGAWGTSNSGGTWGGSGSSSGGWNTGTWGGQTHIVNFSARGSGFFRNSSGFNDSLSGCRVLVQRNQDVEVTFNTRESGEVILKGRAREVTADRITAEMSGNGISGVMQLFRNARDGVREIRMEGTQPVQFQLQWRE